MTRAARAFKRDIPILVWAAAALVIISLASTAFADDEVEMPPYEVTQKCFVKGQDAAAAELMQMMVSQARANSKPLKFTVDEAGPGFVYKGGWLDPKKERASYESTFRGKGPNGDKYFLICFVEVDKKTCEQAFQNCAGK